jgi:pseudouridine-5'-phosphate glycosidase
MVTVSAIVAHAIKKNRPLVALETAVLTSGLPRTPWQDAFGICPDCIDASLPINLALANSVTSIMNNSGALPVWIGVFNGKLTIGLSQEEIEIICTDELATKVSIATIAQSLQDDRSAGTTVATTLLACTLASSEHPIRVFATGGIGGIHQHWATRLDVSADLTALATTATCVVASGAKSILDLHSTVEALETIGVPTLGLECDSFPPFFERTTEDDPAVYRVDSPSDIASICMKHWNILGMTSAVLATVPVPEHVALERGSVADALQIAESTWLESGKPSSTRTPFLLGELAKVTQGKSLIANLELLCNNSAVASEIAIALTV